MSKLTLNDLTNLQNENTAVSNININSGLIEDEFDNSLSRDGSAPNQMEANLDMNSNRLLNLPSAVSSLEPLRLKDLDDFLGAGVTFNNLPTGGTTGQVLRKSSNSNFDFTWHSLLSPEIGYTAPGTGGVLGTVQNRLQKTLWAQDYGAVCNGIADDTVALQNMINEAIALNVPCRFSGSCHITSTLAFTGSCDFGGVHYSTSRLLPAATVSAIVISQNNASYLHDFAIDYDPFYNITVSGANVGITGITVTASSGENKFSRFTNLFLSFCSIGIDFQKASYFVLKSSIFTNSSSYDVLVQNLNSVDSGDSTIQNCLFVPSSTAAAAILQASSGGLRLLSNKVLGTGLPVAYQLQLAAGALTGLLIIIGNSFEQVNTGIKLIRDGNTAGFGNVVISSNEFLCHTAVSIPTDASGVWIRNIAITSNAVVPLGSSAQTIFNIDTAQGFVISDNSLQSANAGTKKFNIGSGCSDYTIGLNPGFNTASFAASTFSAVPQANLELLALSPNSGLGYSAGAGGTVTQATSKVTSVTLNKTCGAITLNNAALAADTVVSFILTNSAIVATDVLVLNHISGGTIGAYTLNAQAGAGGATINVRNNTAGSLSEAIVIQFALIKGVNA